MNRLTTLMETLHQRYGAWPTVTITKRFQRKDERTAGFHVTIEQPYEGQIFRYKGIVMTGGEIETGSFCGRAQSRLFKITGQYALGMHRGEEVADGR